MSIQGGWNDIADHCCPKVDEKGAGKNPEFSDFFDKRQNFLFNNKSKQDEKKRQQNKKIEIKKAEEEKKREEEARAAEVQREIRYEELKIMEGFKLKQTQEFIKTQEIGYFIAHFDVHDGGLNQALPPSVPLPNMSSLVVGQDQAILSTSVITDINHNVELKIVVTLIEGGSYSNQCKDKMIEKFTIQRSGAHCLSSLYKFIFDRYQQSFEIFKVFRILFFCHYLWPYSEYCHAIISSSLYYGETYFDIVIILSTPILCYYMYKSYPRTFNMRYFGYYPEVSIDMFCRRLSRTLVSMLIIELFVSARSKVRSFISIYFVIHPN